MTKIEKSEKPMFDSADIDISSKSKIVTEEVKDLKEEINRIYQIIHQKGLEIGMPHHILVSISEIVSDINDVHLLWKDEQSKNSIKMKIEEADKLLRKGDEILAYHELRSLVLDYEKEKVIVMVTLYQLLKGLRNLQMLLEGRDNVA